MAAAQLRPRPVPLRDAGRWIPVTAPGRREETTIEVIRGLALATAALLLVVLAGPRARIADGAWVEPEIGPDVDAWLAREESGVPGVRVGDERAVAWADPRARSRTPLALVYLHGFSADRHEVEPLVSRLADSLGANVYFARLRGHGRDGAAMAEATAEDWLADTSEAVAIGHRIGEAVVLVGTSTGGTLALWATTRQELDDRVSAAVLISPNLGLRDRDSRFLLWPWGGLLARLAVGSERCFEPENPEQRRHWTTCYPTSALLAMMAVVEHVRAAARTPPRIPTLVLYSTRDRVVDARETERLLGRFVEEGVVRLVRFERADDPAHHVLAGDILSPSSTDAVAERILEFLRSLPRAPGPAERSP